MNIKRFCIVLPVSVVSLFSLVSLVSLLSMSLLFSMSACVLAGELQAPVTPLAATGNTEGAGVALVAPNTVAPNVPDPNSPDLDDVDVGAPDDESDTGETPASESTAESTSDSTIIGHTLSQGAGSATGPTSQLSSVDFGLEEIVASLEKILPKNWGVAGIKRRQVPRKWTGPANTVLIRLEDGSMVIHHPNGFDYHPFYKIWLCPSHWQGVMDNVSITGDEGPSILLGVNHRMKVFYLALGANTWPKGPETLRKVLELTALPITCSLKQMVDPSMRMKIFPRLAATENWAAGLTSRVVGMEKDGALAYLEYATATDKKTEGSTLPSRCKESRVVNLMDRENLVLVDQIFFAYPEVRTVYVRRVCDEFLCDKVFDRSGATSSSTTVVPNYAP